MKARAVADRAAHVFQCSAEISVNSRRAVAAVDLDLVGEPRGDQLGALVVQRGALAVDRLDLARARGADRGVIGLADEEIVLQQRPERRHRHDELGDRLAGLGAHVEAQLGLLLRDASGCRGRRRARCTPKLFSSTRSKIATARSWSWSATPRGSRRLVEQHFVQPLARLRGRLALMPRRSREGACATERAWAPRPSASPSVTAAGPSAASDRASHLRIEVRLTKS